MVLLSPVANFIGRLFLDDFDHIALADQQFGFRKHRSMQVINTALHYIATDITNGLNHPSPHRTVLVALDLNAAFDTVDHGILQHPFENSSLQNNTKR